MSTPTLELPSTSLQQQDDDARKAAWLAERRTCITGTDIAAIFGMSKYASPIDIWLSKKAQLEVEVNDAMEFGTRFERPILEVYAERTGIPLEFADHWTLHHVPGFPLLGASLDARRLNGDRRPVDAKTAGFKSDEWGESGSDNFPIAYQFQLAVQMMACDEPETGFVTPAADLAVCFGGYGGHKFAPYTLYRDPEIDAAIKERAEEWWQKHIVGDTPPEPDGSESYGEYLKARFRRSTEITMPVTAEVAEWAASLRTAMERIKDAEVVKEAAQQRIKAYMGDAAAIPGICTWKNNKDSDVIDWHAAFESFWFESAPQHGLGDSDKLEIVATFTSTKPGPRVFRMSK